MNILKKSSDLQGKSAKKKLSLHIFICKDGFFFCLFEDGQMPPASYRFAEMAQLLLPLPGNLVPPGPQCAAEPPRALPTCEPQKPYAMVVAEQELSFLTLILELGSSGRCEETQQTVHGAMRHMDWAVQFVT